MDITYVSPTKSTDDTSGLTVPNCSGFVPEIGEPVRLAYKSSNGEPLELFGTVGNVRKGEVLGHEIVAGITSGLCCYGHESIPNVTHHHIRYQRTQQHVNTRRPSKRKHNGRLHKFSRK